jgi:hypothetical protein
MKKVYVATLDGRPLAVANNLVRLGVELGYHPKHFTRIKLPYTTRKGVLISAMPLLTSKRNSSVLGQLQKRATVKMFEPVLKDDLL